ncbi:MAG TPA: sigma-70 family RNA polymerase sigma factor [Longimicrobiales bacterium]|nr:sigma-70 family RNA polymerase sigma factor [Longimicrobiales bacterium]
MGRTPDTERHGRESSEGPGGRQGPADAWLARRVQQGEREAFELLARRYLRPVHAIVASFLREQADVEDAAQETFLRALERIGSYDPDRPFAPWLYQIARNVARNHVKWRRRHPAASMDEAHDVLPDTGPTPASGAQRAEIRRLVAVAVEELPEQRRTAFRLADVEGYSASEVAGMMGLTAGAVRAHIHHARRDLRARLGTVLRDGNET